MDFAKALASDSIKAQSGAALFLRGHGVDGYPFLPELLVACKRVDLQQAELSKIEEALVGFGALSLGTIVSAVGFDAKNDFHRSVANWLIHLSASRHVHVALYAIYGLGELGVPPASVRYRLEELIDSERRSDDTGVITCRAVAFRMLARINRKLARTYINTAACNELRAAVEHWLLDYQCHYPENATVIKELGEEASWLRQL